MVKKYKKTLLSVLVILICVIALLAYNRHFIANLIDKKLIVSDQNGSRIVYIGSIDQAGVDYMKMIYQESYLDTGRYPSILRVTSHGGFDNAGISMGTWIIENKLDVEVIDRCLSACANYVFLAGKRKILGKNSILGWHGSATHPKGLRSGIKRAFKSGAYDFIFEKEKFGYAKFRADSNKQYPMLAEREIREMFFEKNVYRIVDSSTQKIAEEYAFYSKLNIDPMLPNYGFLSHKYDNLDTSTFFYYSLEDLKKMGVTNLELSDDVWEPTYYKSFFLVDSEIIDWPQHE